LRDAVLAFCISNLVLGAGARLRKKCINHDVGRVVKKDLGFVACYLEY